ncbi:LOB domain-containing protein 4-like [Ananas comosus]|uniref:LOB domain-containing protein 4-like n=1 Tax=Ananas comosus TaxID=4615 RepID=A0A6P5FK11_ANACO|nr:LOB domain-containing protein 4-like [Ananas comosus]
MAKGGTSRPACAACKHQRRKCTADCPLALYFPADQPKQFQNAHRLFGVSNILRILKDLDPVQKSEAMKSILYEANVREYLPDIGCAGLIVDLQVKICQLRAEIERINSQIAMYQSDQHQYYHSSTHLQLAPSSSTSQSPLPPAIDNLNVRISHADLPNYDDNNEMKFADPMWANQMYTNNITDGYLDNTATGVQQPFEAVTDTIEQQYDEISPYFDTIDEEKAYESSCGSSTELVQPMMQKQYHGVQNDLKSAAAYLKLTSLTN